jgi:hypothetical protein
MDLKVVKDHFRGLPKTFFLWPHPLSFSNGEGLAVGFWNSPSGCKYRLI